MNFDSNCLLSAARPCFKDQRMKTEYVSLFLSKKLDRIYKRMNNIVLPVIFALVIFLRHPIQVTSEIQSWY